METALYIHIPYCFSKCDYCDFFSVPCGKKNIPDEYIKALLNEISFRMQKNGISSFSSVYIGGGTPSLLSCSQIKTIADFISKKSINPVKEFTIEANPDDLSEDLLSCLNDTAINRLSVGIQALDEDVLKFVHRRSSLETVISALDLLSKKWDRILSTDIIAALPNQTEKSFLQGLSALVEYKMQHISMYSLTIEEETVLGKKYSSGALDYDFDAADSLWLSGKEFLKEKGYAQYEVSNFAQPGYECIHNMAYWKLKNYLGCGSGATGTLYGKKSVRFTNTKNLSEYIDFWNRDDFMNSSELLIPGEREEIEPDVEKFEFFMMGLRTLKGVSLSDYEARFLEPVNAGFLSVMKKWEGQKKAYFYENCGKSYFSLGEEGILFLNKFLREII